METPVILSAVRTPIGKFQGGLSSFSAPELGGKIVAEAVRRAGLEGKQVDEAILGNVVQAGLGQNPARQAALKGGCDPRVAAMTINKVCGSGLKAVALAAQAVQLGESEIVVAGGMESMSNCPYLLPQARTGYRHLSHPHGLLLLQSLAFAAQPGGHHHLALLEALDRVIAAGRHRGPQATG